MLQNIMVVPMGTRISIHDKRSMLQCEASIAVMKKDGVYHKGINLAWGRNCHFFVDMQSTKPEVFLRALFATSKMFQVGRKAVEIAILLAKGTPSHDLRFEDAGHYLSYGYTVEKLKKKVSDQKINKRDLHKVYRGFKKFGIEIENPIEALKKTRSSVRITPFKIGAGLLPGSRPSYQYHRSARAG